MLPDFHDAQLASRALGDALKKVGAIIFHMRGLCGPGDPDACARSFTAHPVAPTFQGARRGQLRTEIGLLVFLGG
jgi:hypothetical protein